MRISILQLDRWKLHLAEYMGARVSTGGGKMDRVELGW